MKSLRADFTEIYSGGGIRRSESGTLWIKKPGKMRWDYASPQKKIFVTDGATAWFYVPGERQARRTSLKKLDDLRSPLRYLLGHTKLEKELRGLSLAPDVQPETAGDVVLRGIPVGMEDRISQVLLESDGQGYLRRIVMEELDGSRTEFRLEDQQENVAGQRRGVQLSASGWGRGSAKQSVRAVRHAARKVLSLAAGRPEVVRLG